MIFYEDSHKKIALILQLEGPHSGANIKEAFLKSLKNFEIESKILGVTTDNASNNVTFLKAVEDDLSQKYIYFNKNDETSNEEVGSLIRKLRTLVKKIKASPQQENKFKAQCKAANVPNLNVMLDVRTRWNSTYDMLVRARKLKEPLNTLSNSDPTLRPFTINEKKWVHLLKIEELLKEAATNAINKLKTYYNKTDPISELYKTLYAPQETQNTNIEYNSSDEDLVSHIFKWRCIELVSEFDRYLKADQAQALCDILNWWK
ncbi:hypothetical protein RclHR1_23330001 [Rhizophagus clarus]|uniref:DUF659 domain-containing protein n=1 Tax=Rhizophagus clarus TaxID=94130 RepID=A0A2Z6R9A9_9GLOM|nr:hypothetical protein RclHR1_23330001 [Rhizophagus clarus]